MRRWYEELFANYAKTYDTETFTRGTLGEVDFLEKELNYDKTKSILDIGCGTGRHAIELARRGYSITGIDLSAARPKHLNEFTGQRFDTVVILCDRVKEICPEFPGPSTTGALELSRSGRRSRRAARIRAGRRRTRPAHRVPAAHPHKLGEGHHDQPCR